MPAPPQPLNPLSPSKPLNVAIVGAGFAGLATAALLARAGHRVTVFEKFGQAQAVGAGILIQPSGLAAMRVLGIHDEVLAQGAPVTHLWGVTPAGRAVVDVRYADWRAGAHGLGLHRGVLFAALWRLAERSGVSVHTGQAVADLAALQAGHDLCVLADGANSSLRAALCAQTGLVCHDSLYPWGAVWAVLPDPERRYGGTLWQWYRRAGQMLGIMPTGVAPAGAAHAGQPVVSLFWSLPADGLDGWRARGLDAFKAELAALHPGCAELLAPVQRLDELTWARYHDVRMPVYHHGRTVVIGDAAHATSPQLGQGTNLALLDACALAWALRRRHGPVESSRGVAVEQALTAYTAERRPHLQFYGQASRWLTPLFQSHQRVLPGLRDAFMGMTTGWPVLGHLTRQTLVGVRQSWWSGAGLRLPGGENTD